MRKWRENFLILPLYPPSLSISYIKICHILSQNVKYGIFVANVTKTEHTRYEEIILGRIPCEEAPQVVSAWQKHLGSFLFIKQHVNGFVKKKAKLCGCIQENCKS